MKGKLLSAIELAKRYDVTKVTVYAWTRKGMPSETVNKGLAIVRRYDPAATDQWVKDHTRPMEDFITGHHVRKRA